MKAYEIYNFNTQAALPGYEALGIIGYKIFNSVTTEGGKNSSFCNSYFLEIDNNNLSFLVKNSGTSDAVIDLSVTVLYKLNL